MPVTAFRNRLYRMALPFFGMRTKSRARCNSPDMGPELDKLTTIFRRHLVVGGCLQLIRKGELGPVITYGCKRLPGEAVAESTVFRTASITKMVTAVGALRMAEKGLLDLDAPAEEYLGFPVRNPRFPDTPIRISHLLSHTSSLWDGPGYEKAMNFPIPLSKVVSADENYLAAEPGAAFRYSNLAAGMIASVMESATGRSLEDAMREAVFDQLCMKGTYTLRSLQDIDQVAYIYRVFPKSGGMPAFDVQKRLETADDLTAPAPEYHYLPAAGNLFIDAISLGKLLCAMARAGSPLLEKESMEKMQTPVMPYGKNGPHASHCLGLVMVDDPALPAGRLYGHQGFAYGTAEGAFYDPATGDGFVFLNNGASEARIGHLACVNRDLILWSLGKNGFIHRL